MADAGPTVPALSDQGNRGRGQRSRGRAGYASYNRNNGPDQPTQASASATQTATITSNRETAPPHAPSDSSVRRGRGRGRGGRGRSRHRAGGGNGRSDLPTQSRGVQGRAFGGQLTEINEDAASEAGPASLQGDAPAFVPGSSNHSAAASTRRTAPRRQRRMSRSSAADLPTRIHEDIDNGHYECQICTEPVRRKSKTWSCQDCWSVFHNDCIKTWASGEAARASQHVEQDGAMPPARWRCPGCNLPRENRPGVYTCWCGKETEPRPLPGLPPHSCGQTCSREHILPKGCPHPCSLVCHAGPCPPCTQMGPAQSCFCGREVITRKCIDTVYQEGWGCEKICGELMPCGLHTCQRLCHEGLCGACEVRMDARCYCGQVSKAILCCDREDEKQSRKTTVGVDGERVTEEWTASFKCANVCGQPFDCGIHMCEKPCHVQDGIAHCPLSPDVVDRCPCGKTELAELTDKVRTNCEDAISLCKKACAKILPCGHTCQRVCHVGDCPPCTRTVSIKCRCGRTSHDSMCHQGEEEPPYCMRVCKATLNCGRHQCGERCCPGEKKAADRLKRKPRALGQPAVEFEAEHICTETCGRLLKCGNHTCQDLCHKGPCSSCREAVFEDISCNCGRTILQPPLPCGTRPPPCPFPCERQRECGHPQVAHNCHLDEERCVQCPFLTTKTCLCEKTEVKNVPCWRKSVPCGEICGKKLKCGFHQCRKTCHGPGDCEDAGQACQQICGKQKSCLHPCEYKCHAPGTCKEDKPCQHKIFITCDCQRIKQEAKCGATKNTEGNASKGLKCDDECARLERNRKLAIALNVDPENRQDDHVPYEAETLNLYLANPGWAQIQEKELRAFATDPDVKRMRFKPMKIRERKFIHSLCNDFGFDSESMDPEGHRHVAVFKTPRFVMAPMKTLAECARIRQTQQVLQQQVAKQMAVAKASEGVLNAFLITQARFGLTVEEIRSAIVPVLTAPGTNLELDIQFLPTEEVVLLPIKHFFAAERNLQSHLESLKPSLSKCIFGSQLGSLQLCRVDASLNILRRETDAASSGWSQVAKAAAAPRRPATVSNNGFGSKNGFAVFETSAAKQKKLKEREKAALKASVEDDWEAAEVREEEKERLASAVNSGDEGLAGDVD